jgi:hypothetical protein
LTVSAKIHTREVKIIERSDSEREPYQNEALPMKLLLEEIMLEDSNGSKENPPELVEPGPRQPQTETVQHEI